MHFESFESQVYASVIYFGMTSLLTNYKRKSIVKVFEHFLKRVYDNNRSSFTKFCFEVRNVLSQLAEYLIFQVAPEKEVT